jgi:hypothetical protein
VIKAPHGHGQSDPAQFYTGLVAQMYALLRSTLPDPEPCARFIEAAGEPALELGCGDGDPLLALRARGIDLEGLDSSRDMLTRCRARAIDIGLDVVLHESAMETMQLPRSYRSIYLAGPTFNLLPDDAHAARALERAYAHLVPGGVLRVPLFVPAPIPASIVGHPTVIDLPEEQLRLTVVGAELHSDLRVRTCRLRYERRRGDQSELVEREWVIHWHTQDGFGSLAEHAGFHVASVRDLLDRAAPPEATEFVFELTRR